MSRRYEKEKREKKKQRLRILRGMAYMYAATAGAQRNSEKLQMSVVGVIILVISFFLWTHSIWISLLPVYCFVGLMFIDALIGVRQCKIDMRKAQAARNTETYYSSNPAGSQILEWAKGRDGGYAFLIGLAAPAGTYAGLWPLILGLNMKEQLIFADVMTRVYSSPTRIGTNLTRTEPLHDSDAFVRTLIQDFRLNVSKPTHKPNELNLTDANAIFRTRLVANLAWCVKYGPEHLKFACINEMARVCNSGGIGQKTYWEIRLYNTNQQQHHQQPKRNKKQKTLIKHQHQQHHHAIPIHDDDDDEIVEEKDYQTTLSSSGDDDMSSSSCSESDSDE